MIVPFAHASGLDLALALVGVANTALILLTLVYSHHGSLRAKRIETAVNGEIKPALEQLANGDDKVPANER